VASTQQEAVIKLTRKLTDSVMQTDQKCVNAVAFARISRLPPNPSSAGLPTEGCYASDIVELCSHFSDPYAVHTSGFVKTEPTAPCRVNAAVKPMGPLADMATWLVRMAYWIRGPFADEIRK
jgi:hypothetical protein